MVLRVYRQMSYIHGGITSFHKSCLPHILNGVMKGSVPFGV